MINFFKSLFIIFLLNISLAFAEVIEVQLSQKVNFNVDKIYKLKDTKFSVKISEDKGSKCAVPGRNCGSGYIPPYPTYEIECDHLKPCPYIFLAFPNGNSSGYFTIETIHSCEKNNPEICFREYSKQFNNDTKCMSLPTSLGQYYCLKNFEKANLPEYRTICDQLPDSIFALKWNCFYEYAIRFQDISFCEKYTKEDLSGRDRCLLKMAEILKDKNICKKIIESKENTYKEQCLNLKLPTF